MVQTTNRKLQLIMIMMIEYNTRVTEIFMVNYFWKFVS